MGIQRKATSPAGITNASGQPEIVLEIDGLTISMTPGQPLAPAATDSADQDSTEPDDAE